MPDGPERAPARPYIRFSAAVAREVCQRIAAGEAQGSVCADPRMPCTFTLRRWARERPAFAQIFARARAMGGRDGTGKAQAYDPMTAFEIVARVSEGESLTSICDDPAMPCARTVFNWRKRRPEFEAEMRIAREVAAERFCDLGWKLAMEATPGTAHLTRVRLAQLRWTAAILSPGTHGRHRAVEPPQPAEPQTVLLRHFRVEIDKATGQQRVVGFTPDPATMLPVRDSEGPWSDPVDPAAKAAGIEAAHLRRQAGLPPPTPAGDDDPEGWR